MKAGRGSCWKSTAFRSALSITAAVKAGANEKQRLVRSYDAIILPDIDANLLEKGRRKTEDGEMKYAPPYPEPYAGGLGEEGVEALTAFVEGGGTLIAMADASDFVIDKFNVPVVNSLAKVKKDQFSAPGAILLTNVDQGHPVTLGLPPTLPIFHAGNRAFSTSVPGSETEREILLWYPREADEILLSGWIRGEERLAGRVAAVALEQGEGKIVLFGFSPQNRAQTHGTFPLLFNALYWSSEQ